MLLQTSSTMVLDGSGVASMDQELVDITSVLADSSVLAAIGEGLVEGASVLISVGGLEDVTSVVLES